MAARLSKAATHYTPDAGVAHYDKCKRCRHFEKPDSCTLVLGKISPEGWCTEFEK